MVDVTGGISVITNTYNAFLSWMPSSAQNFVNLFLLVLLVVIYAVFIWKLYRFIAKKNIFELNLNKYNKLAHPFFAKAFASVLYLLEYIIILPFVIFFWFAAFTFFLVLLTNNIPLHSLIIVAVIVIAAVRMTSYIPKYGENLAKEIAKLLPLNLLAIALIGQSTFNFDNVLTNLGAFPGLIGTIFNYLIFIIILEIILRFFEFIFNLAGLYEPPEEDNNEKSK